MEDRYEIRGKIGQGGLGAVYRGYDKKMNREVAIKRIAKSLLDPSLQEESTLQLIKEASALASLQSPHIVTVYDVGTDDDEPYVVMELISGKTLDEVIEHAPLAWPDFRELALQTQEALIAAQELNLIHSDIKPANLMLNWLPSGKLLVKIVDFGLATLTHTHARENLENMDAVFGSIYFMPPEQFERAPLDTRSDLYSMGCVYYQALCGSYPFNGTTCQEVMQSHLDHKVRPLHELRPDLPSWACDWVMWHINRAANDRPDSARESLGVFVQNEKNPAINPPASGGAQKRSKLIIPMAPILGNPVSTATGPAPTTAPPTAPISPTPTAPMAVQMQGAGTAPLVQAAPAADGAPDKPIKTSTVPQALAPPPGSKPSVHTATHQVPLAHTAPIIPATPIPAATVASTVQKAADQGAKRKLSNSAKVTIAGIMGLLVLMMGWFVVDRLKKNSIAKIYNEMITAASKDDAVEVPVDKSKLDILLKAAVNTEAIEQRVTVYKALSLAKATDGTDVDGRISEFATTEGMRPDIREVLIGDVIRMRNNPAVVPSLMAYAARNYADPRTVVAALQAVRFMASDEQFGTLLNALDTAKNEDVRKAAEEAMVQIIGKSSSRTSLAAQLASTYKSSANDSTRHAMLRLLGHCGGDTAMDLIKKALAEGNMKDQIAAIISLGSWTDESAISILADFISGSKDENLRDRAFTSASRYISEPKSGLSPEKTEAAWRQFSGLAKTTSEQIQIVRGLALRDEDWVVKLLEEYTKSPDSEVSNLAGRALDRVRDRKKLNE